MAIYLGLPSPAASSNLPGSRRAALRFLFGLASDGVYRALPVTRQAVVSYTAFPPLLPESLPKPGTARGSGIFLLHFPWSRLHQTLSGILPCEARTFLPRKLTPAAAAICLTQNLRPMPGLSLPKGKARH